MNNLKNKIPNILTAIRIALIPLIIYCFYTHFRVVNMITATLFGLASLTDFFDGYLARKNKIQSNFGRCLDPIADKLLVSVTLIMLINFNANNLIILISSLIVICREILVSGLREFLASINVPLPVSRLGKWKTAAQMVAIIGLLLAGQGSDFVYNEIMEFANAEDIVRIGMEGYIQTIGETFLCISSFLTILSGYQYVKVGIKNF
ncbi:MAG: CDP-diacylglycerol--glycerol-3-phosphate 3-phosphatidyltransferase [Rickettsiales bacterium]|jgi:CDP-diacylglycerol--glycerol-3-phosphate 3-phosphatidyltransferase|nr:CDP-diacylglycerol--glycerol-3-phosphate 3-phosphatidyltransferase [Rickettsiales bacterium]